MTDTKMLIGSLSNDLYRVATSIKRGSYQTAKVFWQESKKRSNELAKHELKKDVLDIINYLNSTPNLETSTKESEKLLKYSAVLQNYSLDIE